MKRRVVITGTGSVTSLGMETDKFWNSIKNGKCGISRIERIEVSDLPTKVGAEIKDFQPLDYIEKKEAKRMDRYAQYAMAAAQIAVENSGLNVEKVNKERLGVIIGSGVGGIETLEAQHNVLIEKGPDRISALFVPMMIANMAAGFISIKFGAKGFSECIVTACASSSNSVGDALRVIERNDTDIMITGGTEAPITRLALAGFCANKTMSANEDPYDASKPFDLNRNGFVMGEGAGVLILEELEHALNRGADIIAEIVGYGCTNDAFHITASAEGGEGGARCMKLAIEDAAIKPSEVQYINAHGTSTKINDKNETAAIKTVFGEYAHKLDISSTKSMTGHLLGASGAIEAIITALAIKEGFIPPTINYKTPDPECDLHYVPNEGKPSNILHALTNSFGFGGHNATLVLKAFNS